MVSPYEDQPLLVNVKDIAAIYEYGGTLATHLKTKRYCGSYRSKVNSIAYHLYGQKRARMG